VLVLSTGSRALADNCNQAWTWYEEGQALFDNSAREAFYYQRALELCPQLVEARNSLGRVYQNQGRYELSIKEYEEAAIQALSSDIFSSSPGSRDLFLESIIGLGEIYRFQARYDLAATEFTRALEIYPNSLVAQNNLQYVYKRLNRYDNVLSPHNRLLTNAVFTRIPGLTLPRGSFLFDLQYRNWYQEAPLTKDMFDDESIKLVGAPESRATRVQLGIIGIRYGLTNDLTLGLIGRYLSKELNIEVNDIGDMQAINGSTTARPDATGFGDLEFLLKYHLWGQRKTHLSFYNILTLPVAEEKTARTDVTVKTVDNNNKVVFKDFHIKRRVPMGADSFDFTPGLAFSTFLDPAILHINLQYRITDGKYIGDEFRTDCAIIYPLNKSVNATIETEYRWRDDTRQELLPPKSDVSGSKFTEKGGHTVFVSPGFQFAVGRGLKLEMGVKIPVVKQQDGWEEDFVFHVGMAKIVF
jgi:hypothetical protein